MTTWAEVIENLTKGHYWWRTITPGKYIKMKYPDYNHAKISGGSIMNYLIKLYYERFECFPDEYVGEILRDKAYKEWKLRSK